MGCHRPLRRLSNAASLIADAGHVISLVRLLCRLDERDTNLYQFSSAVAPRVRPAAARRSRSSPLPPRTSRCRPTSSTASTRLSPWAGPSSLTTTATAPTSSVRRHDAPDAGFLARDELGRTPRGATRE